MVSYEITIISREVLKVCPPAGTGNWRDIYWVGAGLIGSTGLLVFFTFPGRSLIDTVATRHLTVIKL